MTEVIITQKSSVITVSLTAKFDGSPLDRVLKLEWDGFRNSEIILEIRRDSV